MKTLLVVIDMQNDFIDGALGTAEAAAIVSRVAEKLRHWPAGDVIATMDTHGTDYPETQEGKHLPVPHCIRGTVGWNLRAEIAALLTDAPVYEKPAFGSVQLAADLRERAQTEDFALELVGLCTDICVVSNALLLKAMLPEVPISVDASCCAGVTPERHRAALETMRACQVEIRNDP